MVWYDLSAPRLSSLDFSTLKLSFVTNSCVFKLRCPPVAFGGTTLSSSRKINLLTLSLRSRFLLMEVLDLLSCLSLGCNFFASLMACRRFFFSWSLMRCFSLSFSYLITLHSRGNIIRLPEGLGRITLNRFSSSYSRSFSLVLSSFSSISFLRSRLAFYSIYCAKIEVLIEFLRLAF